MNCAAFEAYLNSRLDERLPLALNGQAEVHLQECAACQQLYRGFEALCHHLAASAGDDHSPPVDFSQRVLHAFANSSAVEWTLSDSEQPAVARAYRSSASALSADARRVARRLARRSAFLAWAASAALLLAAIVPMAQPVAQVRRDLPARPATDVAAAPLEAARPIGQLAADAKEHYLDLARYTGDNLSDALAIIRPATPAAGESQAAPSLAFMGNLTTGFRPLTQSTTPAVRLLMRAWPAADQPHETAEPPQKESQ
jgi:hypothetical protein